MLQKVECKGIEFFLSLEKAFYTKQDLCCSTKPAVLVYPFGLFSDIDLSLEIAGKTNFVKTITKYSADINSTVFCPIKSKILDMNNLSVVVANKGKIIDIADRTQNPLFDEFGTSGKIKVYNHKAGKIGLLIDTDCLVEDSWETLDANCDIALCISKTSQANAEKAESLAYKYNMNFIYVDKERIIYGCKD